MSSVRRASEDMLAAIVELDRACFPRPWTAAAWLEEVAREAVWVSGDPVCALACAVTVMDVCELRRIATAPADRGRGLARDLLATIIDHARRHACARIELEVAASNGAAIRLYRGHGFVVVGRRVGYYRDPLDDALLMTLDLGANDVRNGM